MRFSDFIAICALILSLIAWWMAIAALHPARTL